VRGSLFNQVQNNRPARAVRTKAEAALMTELSVHMLMVTASSLVTVLMRSASVDDPAFGAS